MNGDLIWRALADPTRRALLDDLSQEGRTTGDLVARHDHLCRTAVMKHLDVLEAAELVIVRRDGRVRWNYLNPIPIQRVCERWIHRHTRHLAGALSRLKRVAEGPVDDEPRGDTEDD
jgi:DNA-binding transcriptional ArsR family regulator